MKLTIFYLFPGLLISNLLNRTPIQGSIITPNDPQEKDFMSNNSELIWLVLIVVFLVTSLTYAYVISVRKKRKREEEEKRNNP